jgi:predicted TIM-barrel fold metal-dependent hydrolase
MTVDIHQHLWPEPFVEALAARREPPHLVGDDVYLAGGGRSQLLMRAWPLEKCLAKLDEDGIDVALVSPSPTLGIETLPEDEQAALVDAYHAGMRELVERAGGRLVATASGRALDGFAGATVPAHRLVAEWDELEPLLAELERRNQLLFVHPGPPAVPPGAPRWWQGVVDFTAQMQAAYGAWLAWGAAAHPGLKVVFTILAGGAPFQLERYASRGVGEDALRSPNVFFETASYGARAISLTAEAFGTSQLLYGSDLPVIDSTPTLEAVRALGLEETAADNARRLLGL